MAYYNDSEAKVVQSLRSNVMKGLSSKEAEKRQLQYGPNELKEQEKINPLVLFLNQFKSFIIYILLFAVAISVFSGEWVDALVIMIILLFNAFFGFIQEYKAEKAIEALKSLTALKTKVLRNGKQLLIPSKDLVPGDMIFVEEGDKVAADARILETLILQVSEASLTGESMPVSKVSSPIASNKSMTVADQKNMLFSGTVITKGRGKAIVVGTGMKTEIGKIAGMISEIEEEKTPLQKKLEDLGKWIGTGTIVICIIIFFAGLIEDHRYVSLLNGNIIQFILDAKVWLLTAVSLAVAAVPEGLPAIVTIALALGVRKMVKRNALVRRLPSVETLGETTVICSDKTGTLTKNEMTVTKAYMNGKEISFSGIGYDLRGSATIDGKRSDKDVELLFRIGVFCNNAAITKNKEQFDVIGDPTEAALLVSAAKVGIDYASLIKSSKRFKEEPFDSVRKMMSTVQKDAKFKKPMVFTKGAPEHVLKKCSKMWLNGKVVKLNEAMKKKIQKQNEAYGKQALRVLAFAYKEYRKNEALEKNLIFVGLQGMIDPPHDEVKNSIKKCYQAGISVIMVTGDNIHTAEAIAKQIGIVGKSMLGADFARLSEQQKLKALKETAIFARVEPGHKMEIVTLLQKRGEVVAMTGDGVNDAPAIKKADIGIAMGIKGTDVAKEASDMILEDDNFTSIVNAVEEGRGIYENITKFVNYLLSCNLGEVLVIFFALVFRWPLPMSAIMLLWLNLVTDGLPALALSVDTTSNNLMSLPPKKAKEGIMNKSMLFNIFFVSFLITTSVLGLFYWGMKTYQGFPEMLYLDKIETIAFTSIIIMELVRLQAIRSEYHLGIFSNKYLVLAVLTSFLLQLMVIYTPLHVFFGTALLSVQDWVMIIGAVSIVASLNVLGTNMKNRFGWFRDG